MSTVVLDANAVIAHGRAFPERVRARFDRGAMLVLPHSVKRELADDVLANESAPSNHRRSARTIQQLVDDGYLRVRKPDFDTYSDVVDRARRRIADDSLPEHAVQADQYIPAIVCELANDDDVQLVTADRKLGETVREVAESRDLSDRISIQQPGSVL